MHDFVIVGAGLTGSTIARALVDATKAKVLVVDKRSHIAGNLYDHEGEHGIRIQDYGPHSFHTSDKRAYDFITRFCTPDEFILKCESVIRGVSTPAPFNFKTIDQFYDKDEGRELKQELLDYFQAPQATVTEMLDADEESIREYARFLFESDYRLYTAKQWNLQPEEIDPSVLARVPVVFSYRDTYFDDTWQFMPRGGFTKFGAELLDHPNIEVQLNEDGLSHIELDEINGKAMWDDKLVPIVYTGAIDELFDYRYGELPYRSLRFDVQYMPLKSYQAAPVVAYPEADDYVRATEYTKLPLQDGNGWTAVAFEYSLAYQANTGSKYEPYYPVLTEDSKKIYEHYLALVSNYRNLTLCGRLADFKYYNMDQAVVRALDVSEGLIEGRQTNAQLNSNTA